CPLSLRNARLPLHVHRRTRPRPSSSRGGRDPARRRRRRAPTPPGRRLQADGGLRHRRRAAARVPLRRSDGDARRRRVPRLPGLGADRVTDAAREDEARALARLDETGAVIVAGVERQVPGWARAQVERLLDAWGHARADARVRAEAQTAEAGAAAARRIVAELRALFAMDPQQQQATPLEVVRTAYREPTEVLAAAG